MRADPHPSIDLKVGKQVLDNGLTLLLYEDHRLPQAAVSIWYHVGSKDETPGKTGFAHLFEHMMFQGSEHYPDDFFKPMEEIGGRLNGSTSEDRTNYWEVVPIAYLERALWLESDRMGHLLPAMDQAKLDNQREVVKNERRQTMDNEPYGVAEEALLEALYPVGHPYHHSVIGSMSDLDRATLEDVKDFFRRFYTPNNASLCLAGDIEPAAALAMAERYFGSIPQGPVVSPVKADVPVLTKPNRLTVGDKVKLPRLHLQWPTPCQLTQEDATLSVLAYILATGKDSRLVKRLQVESHMAQSLWAYQRGGEVSGSFLIAVTAQPEQELGRIEEAAWEELERLKVDGVEEEEVRAAVDSVKAGLIKRLQTVGGFGGISDMLNYYQTFTGDPKALSADLMRYEAVTPALVREAARNFLPDQRYSMVAVVPEATLPPEVQRVALPGAGPDHDFSLPKAERLTLPNGAALWVLPQHGLPLVTVTAVMRAGATADLPESPGLAHFVADLLDESAAGMGPVELARRQKTLATSLSTTAEYDHVSLSLTLLTGHFEGGLGLLADILQRPEFRAEDLERLKKTHLSTLMRQLDEAPELGERMLRAALYGEHTPYGHPPDGTKAALESFTRDQVRAFYEAHYGPENLLLVIVGDASVEQAEEAAASCFGRWIPGKAAPASPPVEEESAARHGLLLVDKPRAPQAYITAAVPALSRQDPRYPAFLVFNAILGGQFTSRINMNLREEKGYTYGARSYIDSKHGIMPWVFYTAVQADKTVESLMECKREVSRIGREAPVTAEEFSNARANLVLRFPQGFETQGQLAQMLRSLWVYGLPEDYHERLLARLKALSLEDVRDAAARVVDPQNLLWVVVGDRASLEERLPKAGLGKPIPAWPPGVCP